MTKRKVITEYEFMLEFLRSEWCKKAFDGVRDIINIHAIDYSPHALNSSRFSSAEVEWHNEKTVKALLLVERHIVLKQLPLGDIDWMTTTINRSEFGNLRIIKEDTWQKSFPFCKTVKDVARAILSGVIDKYGHAHKIREIQQSCFKNPFVFTQRLITISHNSSPGSLLEGNHRAVAFMLENMRNTGHIFMLPKQIIVGRSYRSMRKCCWYNYKAK